jgi:hypothetical protein
MRFRYAGTIVLKYVALAGRNDEADFRSTSEDHALNQILAHSAGAFDRTVIAAADRE